MGARPLEFSRWEAGFALFASAALLPVCLFGGVYGSLEVVAWTSDWLVQPAPQGWPPVFALVGGPLLLYASAELLFGVVAELSTVLNEYEASQRRPPFMRRKPVAWSAVTEVKRSDDIYVLKICSRSNQVVIKLNFYKQPREVERFVREHVPPGTRFTGDAGEPPTA